MMKRVSISFAGLLPGTAPRTSYMHAKCSTTKLFSQLQQLSVSKFHDKFYTVIHRTVVCSETLQRILLSVSTFKGCNTFLIFSNRRTLNLLRANMIHVESNNKNKVAKNKVANKNKKKCHLVKRFFKLKIILYKHHFTIQIFISFIYY